MENKNRNLYRLDELSDYKIASNYSDIRGWKIVDADNRTIGKIDNLWVNKDMQRVVYLDVNVDKALIEDSSNEVHDGINRFVIVFPGHVSANVGCAEFQQFFYAGPCEYERSSHGNMLHSDFLADIRQRYGKHTEKE